jgi:hypothetical protein
LLRPESSQFLVKNEAGIAAGFSGQTKSQTYHLPEFRLFDQLSVGTRNQPNAIELGRDNVLLSREYAGVNRQRNIRVVHLFRDISIANAFSFHIAANCPKIVLITIS